MEKEWRVVGPVVTNYFKYVNDARRYARKEKAGMNDESKGCVEVQRAEEGVNGTMWVPYE